jgi:hypothetical protein
MWQARCSQSHRYAAAWLVSLLVALEVAPAAANPITVGGAASCPSVVIPLVLEAMIVALYLRRFGGGFWRTFFLWLGVTFSTFVILVAGFAGCLWLAAKLDLGWLPSVSLLVLEVFVVLVEAAILRAAVDASRNQPEDRQLGWGQALLLSLVANVASVGAGYATIAASLLIAG